MTSPSARIALPTLFALALATSAGAEGDPSRCVDELALPRLARIAVDSGGPVLWARVLEHADGVPRVVSPIGDATLPLREALERSAQPRDTGAPVLSVGDGAASVCAPLPLTQDEIDAERRVVVAAGLNYAAHAEESGGGDVFVFPKPVEPGAPYASVSPPEGVRLLDYEVELAFVLLEDVRLADLPSRDALLATSAFFVSNDLTDREAIIVRQPLSGVSAGFVEAKGQPHFLPAGPWLVRGTELFAALEACGGDGLRLQLEVDEGEGFVMRQDASTAAMLLDPPALLARIAREVADAGPRTAMPVERSGEIRHYPLAVAEPEGDARLPAGSVVLTGTPEGVALRAPSPLGVAIRGLLNLRGPIEQFRREELERATGGESGGYLAPGHRVRARIDGLGTQTFRISELGDPMRSDPCNVASRRPNP